MPDRIANLKKRCYIDFVFKKGLVSIVLLFIATLSLYSCGGGSGETINPLIVKSLSVSTTTFSRTENDNITFSISVDPTTYSSEYYVNIYLEPTYSTNKSESSTLITSATCTSPTCTITITPLSEGYSLLTSSYGGVYDLKFDIFKYKGEEKVDTVKYVHNFVIKNIWTIMIYMDGDNNLNDATTYNLNQMEQVGSSNYVGIIVQDDTYSGPAERYFVETGNLKTISNLGEVNMGNYTTLVSFAKWAVANYPADHYMLVLWDHGKGFENLVTSTAKIQRDIIWDDHPIANYSMSIPDLAKALSEIKDYIGKKIDIVGMDACLMNMIEVAYGIKNYADYMVGSENTEPFDGWPYNTILKDIETNTKELTPKEISEYIVKDYINSYTSSYSPTCSAIDLGKVDNVTYYINRLATSLINGINNDSQGVIKDTLETSIFEKVQRFDENGDGIINDLDSYADLYNLAQLIYQNDNMTSEIKNAAEKVIENLPNAVVLSEYKNTALDNSHGLSIWFPTRENYLNYIDHYSALSFAKNTQWENFIKLLW